MFDKTYTGFKSVIDFKSRRPALPALGFYAFHVAVCVAVSSLVSGVVALVLVSMGMDYHQSAFIGVTVRIAEALSELYAVGLCALIMHARDTWRNPLSYLVPLVALALGLFGGALLGIIPAAVMLTLDSEKK